MTLAEADDGNSSGLRFVHVTTNSAGEEMALLARGQDPGFWKRVWGCVLLHHLSERAVDEALQSLTDIFEFELECARPPLLPTPATTSKGKVVSVRSLSQLVIEE